MLDPLVRLLAQNKLLVIFLVAAIGYPLGRIKVRGGQLGVAALLFVGLGAGALSPELEVPDIVYQLGLAIFVYTVGLASGPAFVASLRRDGLRTSALAVGMVAGAAGLSVLAARLLHLGPALGAGLFSGALTNTPALAGAIESLKQTGAPAGSPEAALAAARAVEPVVAYSIAYPMGVIGVVLAIRVAFLLWRPSLQAERGRLTELGAANEPLEKATILVQHDMGPLTAEELLRGLKLRVILSRLRRAGKLSLCVPETRFQAGDLVVAVGSEAELTRLTARLGVVSEEAIDLDRSEFDLRRIFVSNAEVAGRPLRALAVGERFGAVVTRVKRGDVDLLPHDELRLEPGDRVRVLAPVKAMAAVTSFFGDSYRAVSEVDVLTFALGLALGLLLGILPIPLPGGVFAKLGFAGGPLLVALVLGTLERTGSMVWSLPYSANMTLRQLGLVLFLAGIGTKAGHGFLSVFASGNGLGLFLAAAGVTFTTALCTLFVAYRLMGVPMSLVLGLVAGVFTQPAILGYAVEQTGDESPNVGYASAYPAATIAKILLVQLVLALG
jgi:putative transport protein